MSKITYQLNQLSTFASHHNDPRASFLPSTFRPLAIGLLLTFSLLIFNSCGLDIEDPTPPSPPVWVEKSLAEEWPERGIDAHESGGIFLEWSTEANEDINAIAIFRCEISQTSNIFSEYSLVAKINKESGQVSKYIDNSAMIGASYSYKLKAEDSSGNNSDFSLPNQYRLLTQIGLEPMAPNGQNEILKIDRMLNWAYPNVIQMEDYCITILSPDNELVTRTIFLPNDYTGWAESWQIPSDIVLLENQLYHWRIDMLAQYSLGVEMAGSESPWAVFLYKED